MKLQVNLRLKLTKNIKTLKVKYSTYVKMTYDQYLITSLVMHAKNKKEAYAYIDDITGTGSLNPHFKSLYDYICEFGEEKVNQILTSGLFPVYKHDSSNYYEFYPQLNISIFKKKVYSGNLADYEKIADYLQIDGTIEGVEIVDGRIYDRPDFYQVMIKDNTLSVSLNNNWINISDTFFNEIKCNDLSSIEKIRSTVHYDAEGEGWHLLTDAVVNNLLGSKMSFYDQEGNFCIIKNDIIKRTEIAIVAGLYIYRESVVDITSDLELCNKVVNVIVANGSYSQFKSQTLLKILNKLDIEKANYFANAILGNIESNDVILFALSLMHSRGVNSWSKQALTKMLKISEKEDLNLIYKIEDDLPYSIQQLLQIDYNILYVRHKRKVDEFIESQEIKRNTIITIIGEVTTSGMRERVKALKATNQTKEFSKLCNNLIGHEKDDLQKATPEQLDSWLADAFKLKDLKNKLEIELEKQ